MERVLKSLILPIRRKHVRTHAKSILAHQSSLCVFVFASYIFIDNNHSFYSLTVCLAKYLEEKK